MRFETHTFFLISLVISLVQWISCYNENLARASDAMANQEYFGQSSEYANVADALDKDDADDDSAHVSQFYPPRPWNGYYYRPPRYWNGYQDDNFYGGYPYWNEYERRRWRYHH